MTHLSCNHDSLFLCRNRILSPSVNVFLKFANSDEVKKGCFGMLESQILVSLLDVLCWFLATILLQIEVFYNPPFYFNRSIGFVLVCSELLHCQSARSPGIKLLVHSN